MHQFLGLAFLLFKLQTQAAIIIGRVVKVADGDTITVFEGTTQHKIRLMGIDAPEKNQAFGNRSKQALANNVAGKTVEVEYYKRDRYKRIIDKVTYMGYDINLRQIELGMAWHYMLYEREQDVENRSKYAQAEYVAQRGRVGLWSDEGAVAPWDYRKARRSN